MSPIQVPICYASCSIGTPEDPLPAKLNAISAAGFDAIELSMPDLLSFANSHFKKEVGPKDYDDLCKAGKEVKKLCAEKKLKILVLQPFANFEGWAKDSEERRDAFERAEGWIRIMDAVGTDMLQVHTQLSGYPSDTNAPFPRDRHLVTVPLPSYSSRPLPHHSHLPLSNQITGNLGTAIQALLTLRTRSAPPTPPPSPA